MQKLMEYMNRLTWRKSQTLMMMLFLTVFLSAGGRPLTDKDKAMIKLVFADRWEELQQKAKDLKDSEK